MVVLLIQLAISGVCYMHALICTKKLFDMKLFDYLADFDYLTKKLFDYLT